MRLLGAVAYVGIDHFDALTSGRLPRAVATLKVGLDHDRRGGFVLDLRGNPGGPIVQAAAVAGAFLGRGEILRRAGPSAEDVERFALDRGGGDLIEGAPPVVLVDGGTASAAEIVAACRMLFDPRLARSGTALRREISMTTTFDERERAAELRFVREEEARFHARNRRNRLLANWVCEQMRLSGQASETYVSTFTESAIVTDDDALIERLMADLRSAGIETAGPRLRTEMERCAALARAEQRVGVALDQGSSV
ncbi:ATPase inhibitor subunit zeta [Methylobacterium radiotolerans]|uniref:ATPase inhibitor subunit zeta n=1 Tax=Methylobacterium radiotolerans TaxID=31998 RepID=UPI0009762529